MNSFRKHHMTILEVLVAMAILVIIMGFLSQMVYKVEQISRRQNQQSELFRDQRLLMSIIDQDFQGMVTSPASGEEISYLMFWNSDPSSSYYMFISNTTLGLSNEDSSTLQEVRYEYNKTDSQVIRYFTKESDGIAKWNFTNVAFRNNVGWGADINTDFGDSVVIATNVDSFYIQAFDADDNLIAAVDTTYPSYIVTSVILKDEADNTARKFERKIHFNRGEQ